MNLPATSMICIASFCTAICCGAQDIDTPRVLDQRLKIELFAAEPDLVTPTGIAVDSNGNVYVIESHTHFRPDGYEGPISDRIRLMKDTDGDGRSDEVTTFFQGTTATMNLAIRPNGDVYVATRNEIFRLRDRDQDGKADENTLLVKLETDGNYPHNGLSGFAFDFRGNMFFGFGENLGVDYELIGKDGVTISGGGEGGNIFRCGVEGDNLERYATGFWNPFHLAFDDYGQLFCVDNDPDWRPPCRLLHIVQGGDYGYRFWLGRRGTHPFSSWFGEVPGTLGMIAGTGEAPSGLIAYQSDQLPEEYRDTILSTAWGVHSIERFQLRPYGATYASDAETFIKGGIDFRPVGIAMGPDGSLYLSDWVKRDYELHGHGRVWRISAVEPPPRSIETAATKRFEALHRPTSQAAAWELAETEDGILWLRSRLNAAEESDPRLRALAIQVLAAIEQLSPEETIELILNDPDRRVRLLAASQGALNEPIVDALGLFVEAVTSQYTDFESDEATDVMAIAAALVRRTDLPLTDRTKSLIWNLARSNDAFAMQATRFALQRTWPREEFFELSHLDFASDVPVEFRRQWAQVLMSIDSEEARQYIPILLDDLDSQVRFTALRWIGEGRIEEYLDAVRDRMLADSDIDVLFDAYLATVDLLAENRSGAEFEKQEIRLLDELIRQTPYADNPALIELALRRLVHAVQRDLESTLPEALHAPFLIELAVGNGDRDGSLEAMYALRDLPHASHQEAMEALLASDQSLDDQQLIVGLSGLTELNQETLVAVHRHMAPLGDAERKSMTVEREVLRFWMGRAQDNVIRTQFSELAELVPEYSESVDRIISPLSAPGDRPPADEIESWMEWFDTVDDSSESVAAGEHLFFHPKLARCAACHQVKGRGGLVGPDLSHASQLGKRRLLESILQPSREIAPKYSAWTVITSDGLVRTGVLQTERGSEQIYVDAEGESFRVHFDDIETSLISPKSIMADGLLDNLTPREISELLAFLLSLE